MFAGLVRLVEKNYDGKKISLMFDYDGEKKIATLLIWGYHEKYLQSGRSIFLLGIDFDTEQRAITEWQVEDV